MTRFSNKNIPTVFGDKFLSFPISTAKKCFGRILTTLSGLRTIGAAKVENWALMTTFGTRDMPTQFVAQFLSFPDSTLKNNTV